MGSTPATHGIVPTQGGYPSAYRQRNPRATSLYQLLDKHYDTEGLHRLACYLMRAPVNLSRLRYHPGSELILYESKSAHDANHPELLDPLEFLPRVLIHILR